MKKITIGIVTYNRNHSLAATIESLRYLKPIPDVTFELILVDNFKANHALPILEKANLSFEKKYFFEPRHGIPFSRNKVVDEALKGGATEVAFLDDDEEADSFWLFNLYAGFNFYKSDVIVGRHLTTYPKGTPDWAIHTGFFEVPRKCTGMRLGHASTANVLYSSKIFKEWNLKYNENLALTGGTDSLLAKEIVNKGGIIVYVDDAVVREEVPANRATLSWMVKRSYRLRANAMQHFIMAENTFVAIKFFVTTFLKGLARIGMSTLKALFFKKSEVAKVIITSAGLVGLVGGLFNIQYREYSSPK